MPADLGRADESTARLHVEPSLVAELTFALFAFRVRMGDRGHFQWDWLDEMEAAHPALVARVRDFWGDEPYSEWGELTLLAAAAGVLFETDPAALLAGCEQAAAAGVRVPSLPTEPPDVEGFIAGRLRRLRDDAELRAQYFALLREFVAAAGPALAAARPVAEAASARIARQAAAGGDPLALVPANHLARKESYRGLIRAASDRGRLYVVPLGLTPHGQCFFGNADLLIVAFGPETGEKVTRRRAMAERAAASFKVLSDPTRLALLGRILHAPISVTDLATYFDLSQPTVSVHVKMLREAGLLESKRAGTQTIYTARPERVREFAGDALANVLWEDAGRGATGWGFGPAPFDECRVAPDGTIEPGPG